MNEISSTVLGNVASEPRHVVPQDGPARTSFRLASTTTRFDARLQGYVDGHTTWLTVTCWRGLAFNVAQSLVKGQPVIVHGTLHVREWSEGDRSGREVEIDAVAIGHDLRRGRASFAKVTRPVADRTLLMSGGPSSPVSADGTVGQDGMAGPGEPPDAEPSGGVEAPDDGSGRSPQHGDGAAA
jgi:single-strand DNA-binding protein